MFATMFYWCVVVAACAWSLAKHENGNLWIFAIINALGLIALGIYTGFIVHKTTNGTGLLRSNSISLA